MADDLIIRSETEIGEDAENAMIAQTLTLSDLARTSSMSVLSRNVLGPEFATLHAAGLQAQEFFYMQSCSGAALDRRLADYGLARRAAARAYGPVIFTRLAQANGGNPAVEVTIPVGYTVSARSIEGTLISFTTRAEVKILANTDTVGAVVDCTKAGTVGNVGGEAIKELTGGNIAQLASVTNATAFTSGRDRDNDEQARRLFFDWLDARPRTTPLAAVYGATSYTEIIDPALDAELESNQRQPVQSASCVEYLDAPGPDNLAFVLYVWGHSGLNLTDAQITNIQKRIDGSSIGEVDVEGWRAAGCKALVAIGQVVLADVRVAVQLTQTADTNTRERLRQAIVTAMAATGGGRKFTLKTIFDLIVAHGASIENAQIIDPAADILVAPNQKIMPGTVEVQ